MENLWIVQSSGFNTKYVETTIEALNRLNFEFKDFGVIAKENKISNLNNIVGKNKRYISRGGIMMLDILNNITSLKECATYIDEENDKEEYLIQLRESVDYSEEGFDQNNYKEYNLPLLNDKAEYFTCEEVLNKKFNKKMFIKPSKDLKFFSGGIIEEGNSIEEHIKSGQWRKGYEKETILLSPLVNIYTEYRFFIIDGKVITGSLYRRGQDIFYDSLVPDYMIEKANELAKEYKPADIYVMDLADTDDGIKIVEYNCWNCSGLYHVDAQKLFHEVNEFKKGK